MERTRTPELERHQKPRQTPDFDLVDSIRHLAERFSGEHLGRAEDLVHRLEREHKKRVSKFKWAGGGLGFLGIATTVTSCPFYAASLIGPHTVLVGLGLLIAGGILFLRRPKMKETNLALLVALKNGNTLTVPRLALELDVSFEKAEQIMRELVKSGIAEIDLEHGGPDNVLVYRVKGL
jgi:hypothetical protein